LADEGRITQNAEPVKPRERESVDLPKNPNTTPL
jgi:hypothetical protein